MAMTCTISINPSSGKVNKPVNATLTISNSSSDAINILSIEPLVYPTGSNTKTPGTTPVAIGKIPLGPNTTISVPGSGSLKINFNLTFFAPSITGSSYTVGALLSSADGSEFAPTATTIAITAN